MIDDPLAVRTSARTRQAREAAARLAAAPARSEAQEVLAHAKDLTEDERRLVMASPVPVVTASYLRRRKELRRRV